MNDNIATEEPVIPALERVEQWPADVWLARHYDKEWLSASRAAGALGYDDFSSPLKNHHELRGDIERPDTTLPMELGHMLEPTVDELYKRETGRPTMDPGDYAVICHPDFPWLFVTLDRVTMNAEGERGPLELKTTGSYNLADWKEGSPIGPQIQHQVQMECAELPWGSLAVLVGNTSFFHWDYLHNPDFAEQLLKALDKFHDNVLAGNAPDPTWQDGDVIKALHPMDNGKAIMTDAPHVIHILEAYRVAKEREKSVEKQVAEAKAKLGAAMGGATWIQAGDLRYSYKHQTRVNKATIEPKHEAVLREACIPMNPSSRSEFRVMRKEKIK